MLVANYFKDYNPGVSALYFAMIIYFILANSNPYLELTALLGGLFFGYTSGRFDRNKGELPFTAIVGVLILIFYPLHNHQGVTILKYLPDGNHLTMESLVFTIFLIFRSLSLILWIFALLETMSSDKIIYLTGRAFPGLSLFISIIMRFLSLWRKERQEIVQAQKGIGMDKRTWLKNKLNLISVFMSWSMEKAIILSDSMRARGYGEKNRSSFSVYRFLKKDAQLLIFALAVLFFLIYTKIFNIYEFYYYPTLKTAKYTASESIGKFIFAGFFFLPSIINIREGQYDSFEYK